ncbi:hypothetical protein BDV96DRAFT_647930 [Lophiotrema nucula]|uniref:Protein kinase domain-containing protein n=1 Tax=Lophiotrema nucula TaxID=690887 RepID=A0A6A5Z2I8_9PLEO|nr:hypothetical protein BDV96DRAFT_647930 [Lophiotrema nucula]
MEQDLDPFGALQPNRNLSVIVDEGPRHMYNPVEPAMGVQTVTASGRGPQQPLAHFNQQTILHTILQLILQLVNQLVEQSNHHASQGSTLPLILDLLQQAIQQVSQLQSSQGRFQQRQPQPQPGRHDSAYHSSLSYSPDTGNLGDPSKVQVQRPFGTEPAGTSITAPVSVRDGQQTCSAESQTQSQNRAGYTRGASSKITIRHQHYRSTHLLTAGKWVTTALITLIACFVQNRRAHGCTPLSAIERQQQRGKLCCTFNCGRKFENRSMWERHEKVICPQAFWFCRLCGNTKHPAKASLFGRKDKFREHIRLHHPNNVSAIDSLMKSCEVDHNRSMPFPRRCGFCDVRYFGTWTERVLHLEDHFLKGAQICGWRDWDDYKAEAEDDQNEAPIPSAGTDDDDDDEDSDSDDGSDSEDDDDDDDQNSNNSGSSSDPDLKDSDDYSRPPPDSSTDSNGFSLEYFGPWSPPMPSPTWNFVFQQTTGTRKKGGTASLFQIALPHGTVDYTSTPMKAATNQERNSTPDTCSNTFANSTSQIVMVKQYQGQHRRFFNAEVEALSLLQTHENIVKCYLAFMLRDHDNVPTYNVLLEEARCDLREYWQWKTPPAEATDVHSYWREMAGIADALKSIHQPPVQGGYTRGLHGDIKPENILWFGDRFKIADFGFSHFEKIWTSEEFYVYPEGGTAAYGAPETFRESLPVTQAIDIWSLGCVYSEAIVWTVLGKQGLEIYKETRRNALMKRALSTDPFPKTFHDGTKDELNSLQNPQRRPSSTNGLLDCFHNGESVLPEILQLHNTLIHERRIEHYLIEVANSMLDGDPRTRITAAELLERLRHTPQPGRSDPDSPNISLRSLEHYESNALSEIVECDFLGDAAPEHCLRGNELTREQLNMLEELFRRQPNPRLRHLRGVAARLRIPQRCINKWYQNRRAKPDDDLKKRRDHDNGSPDCNVPSCPAHSGRPWPLQRYLKPLKVKTMVYEPACARRDSRLAYSISSSSVDIKVDPHDGDSRFQRIRWTNGLLQHVYEHRSLNEKQGPSNDNIDLVRPGKEFGHSTGTHVQNHFPQTSVTTESPARDERLGCASDNSTSLIAACVEDTGSASEKSWGPSLCDQMKTEESSYTQPLYIQPPYIQPSSTPWNSSAPYNTRGISEDSGFDDIESASEAWNSRINHLSRQVQESQPTIEIPGTVEVPDYETSPFRGANESFHSRPDPNKCRHLLIARGDQRKHGDLLRRGYWCGFRKDTMESKASIIPGIRQVTAREIQDLRSLIRSRYALDCRIWSVDDVGYRRNLPSEGLIDSERRYDRTKYEAASLRDCYYESNLGTRTGAKRKRIGSEYRSNGSQTDCLPGLTQANMQRSTTHGERPGKRRRIGVDLTTLIVGDDNTANIIAGENCPGLSDETLR